MDTLQTLGLLGPVSALLEHGGLGDFVEVSAPTYPALVREFLATLDVRSDGDIRFRMMGREFLETKDTLARAFGITRRWTSAWQSAMSTPPPTETWTLATGLPEGYEGGDYDYLITHPALRLCHRVLSPAFYGMVDPRRVSMRGWVGLYCLTPESTVTPDWVGIFLESCTDMLRQGCQAHPRTISFGGMITLIAYRLRVDLSELQPLSSFYTYDISTLMEAHILERVSIPHVSEGFRWISGPQGEHHQYLPSHLPIGPTLAAFRIRHVDPDEEILLPHELPMDHEEEDYEYSEEEMPQAEAEHQATDSDLDADYDPVPAFLVDFDRRLADLERQQMLHHLELRRKQDAFAQQIDELQHTLHSFFHQFQLRYPFAPPPAQ